MQFVGQVLMGSIASFMFSVSFNSSVAVKINVSNSYCLKQESQAILVMLILADKLKSQSTRGSKIFGNGQKQPYLKPCLLKASHEQVIKSTLFCLLILMWSRDMQFKFEPPGSNFGSKRFPKFTNFACLLSKHMWGNHKSNDVSLRNWPCSS